ncbi:hypothetical protein ACO11K_000558 [Bacillus cytotoxicus]|uniref:hypothetical protein n=1 Tax=Bacillus cereus group sp. BfR-BA-01492 TaxID=2920361 RepID=UPI001F588DC4|nr:hypothetical protein [Bacillus cereus group sp. BfR-BA-01492]EMA6345033.1 hypothetical protein [Bacillus cytotoxicus]
MTNEKDPKEIDQNELLLTLLNSPDGKNIILEALKLAGADPNTDHFDPEQLEKLATTNIDELRAAILNNPIIVQKMQDFIQSTNLGLLTSIPTSNASSTPLTQEQVLQTILENPSALENIFQLTQKLGIDKDAVLAELAQLQAAINLLKQLPSDE